MTARAKGWACPLVGGPSWEPRLYRGTRDAEGAGLAQASPLPGLLPFQSLTFRSHNDGQVGRREVGTVDKAFSIPFVASEDEISITACCFSQCVYLCNG